MDQPRIVAIARFAERAEQLAIEDLREADHGVERRAQLVAHIGEELRLGAARALGLVAGTQELRFLRLAIGDVARHGDDAGPVARRILGAQRPAAHLDPHIARGLGSARAADSELDGDGLVRWRTSATAP